MSHARAESSPTAIVFFFKQKTAYEMSIGDWSSDVCSSELGGIGSAAGRGDDAVRVGAVGNDARAALETDAPAVVVLDRRLARADVAPALPLGRRGREQQLLGAQRGQDALERAAPSHVTRDAPDLHLVHRVNHGGR